jgi:hypothetical protein
MKFCLLSYLYLLCSINIEKLQDTGKTIRKVLSLKGLFWSNNTYFMVECSIDSGLFSDFGLPIHSFLCHSQLNYCSWLYEWNTCCHSRKQYKQYVKILQHLLIKIGYEYGRFTPSQHIPISSFNVNTKSVNKWKWKLNIMIPTRMYF